MDDTQSADVVHDAAVWDAECQESSDVLNDKLSTHSSGEAEANNYCSVATAAKLLGKSDRHVQRLLKEGHLNGHKIMGRRGLQWVVDCEALAESGVSATPESTLTDQLIVFETKFEIILAELQMLKQKVADMESARMSSEQTELITNQLADAVNCLPADTQKDLVDFDPNQDPTVGGSDKNAKQSWWHRVFAPQITSFGSNSVAPGAT
jgi:excisionase family DNA binding protein